MSNGKLASLIGLGLLLGFFAFEIQQHVKKSNDLISSHDKWMYESCLKLNEAAKAMPSSEQRDCLAERMEAGNE